MAGTLAVTELLSWGVLFYAFAVLLVPMQEDLGWSRSFLSAGIGWAVLLSGLVAPLVGRVLDRHGARWPMTAGSVLGVVALLAWANANHGATYLLAFTLLGIALSLALYEPAFALVAMWFRDGLQRALLLITIGGGFASVVFLPLTSALESQLGWRGALVALAAIYGTLTILPHALILRGRPAPESVQPTAAPGPGAASHPPRPAAAPDSSTRDALRDPAFWWLSSAFMLSMVATGAVTVHLVALLRDRGYDAGTAATFAGMVGLMAVAGRVLITFLTRFVPPGLAPVLVIGIQAVSLVALMAWQALPGLIIFVALFGASTGALTIVRAAIVAEYFGRRAYGAIAGILALSTTVARAAGPVLAGVAYGLSGGYAMPFWVIAALVALAAGLMVVADRRHTAALAAASARAAAALDPTTGSVTTGRSHQ
jgi:MFS family permease